MLVEGMKEDLQRADTVAFTQKDLAFHLSIGRMSRNALLSAFLENIQDILYYLQQRTHMLQGTIEQANRFHPLIASAIKARDGNGAQILIAEHIEAVKRSWGAYDRDHGTKRSTPTRRGKRP
jgi:DNA-binding FadR family transcriptional regulator